MYFRVLSAMAVLSLLPMAGCDRPEAAWEQAREQDTVAAYQEFLQQYPEAPQVAEAEERIQTLRREERWEQVRQADTIEAYQEFLGQFPEGPQAEEARAAIEARERLSRWQMLEGSDDIAALREFAVRYDAHPLAGEARQRIAGLEAEARAREQAREAERQRRLAEEAARTHRVQLAALRTEEQARAGVYRLQERLADMLGDTKLEVVQSGSYHFVRTEPMEEEQASDICQRLKARNQDCLVVKR